MPITGAGAAAAGSTSAGYGVPSNATVPNNAPLPDAFTNAPQSGRYLEPVTKAYTFTADGRLQGFGTVDALVNLALRTTKFSSCLPTLGLDKTGTDEQGVDFRARLAAMVSDALGNLVRAKLVTIVNVDTPALPSNPDAGAVFVKWRNNLTGAVQTWNNQSLGP